MYYPGTFFHRENIWYVPLLILGISSRACLTDGERKHFAVLMALQSAAVGTEEKKQ
jgi:hypothetical protein